MQRGEAGLNPPPFFIGGNMEFDYYTYNLILVFAAMWVMADF